MKDLSESGPESGERVAFWDNARGMLIYLVVLGHFVESVMWNSAQLNALFLVIYSFHMPVFVFMAGLMSKADTSAKQLQKNIASLLVPYVLFETLYSLWEHWTMSTPRLVFSYSIPFWTLWFLLSLFSWRVLLPYLKQLRFAFVWLLVLSVGFCATNESWGLRWSWARTLYFFPFFYAGHLARGTGLSTLLTRPWARWVGAAVLLGASTPLVFELVSLRREWFWGYVTTHQMGYASMTDAWRRLAVYAASFAVGGAFLCLVPRRKLAFVNGWGRRSLAIYLFHSFFHFFALGHKWLDELRPVHPAGRLAIVAVVSALLCWILGSAWWSRWTRWLLRPPTGWLWSSRPTFGR